MTLLRNGPFMLHREVRTEPYETPTLQPVGEFDGLLSRVAARRVEAGGRQGRTTLTATLSLDPDVPVDEQTRVTDRKGRVWQVVAVHHSSGLGLDRLLCELRSVEGRA